MNFAEEIYGPLHGSLLRPTSGVKHLGPAWRFCASCLQRQPDRRENGKQAVIFIESLILIIYTLKNISIV